MNTEVYRKKIEPVLAKHNVALFEWTAVSDCEFILKTEHPTYKLFRNELESALGADIKVRYELLPSSPALGVKHDTEKTQLELLSPIWVEGVGKVLTFGAKKYAAHNWRKGLGRARLLGAALRHLFAYLGGQDNDPETGLSHLLHASCCLMFAFELHFSRPDLDDRYKADPFAESKKTLEMAGEWTGVLIGDEDQKVLMFQPHNQEVLTERGITEGVLSHVRSDLP